MLGVSGTTCPASTAPLRRICRGPAMVGIARALQRVVVGDEGAHQRAEAPSVGHERVDAAVLQRSGGDGPDRGRDDRVVGEAPCRSSCGDAGRVGRLRPDACAPGADVNTTASISPAAAARTEAGERGGVRRRPPPVDDEALHVGAGLGEGLVEAVRAGAVVLHRDARPATPSPSMTSAISAAVSDSATQSADSPAAWIAPARLGPRATIRARASTSRRAPASPAASAASIHPRKPTPVVATTTSGGFARTCGCPRRAARRRCAARCSAPARADGRPATLERRRQLRPTADPR